MGLQKNLKNIYHIGHNFYLIQTSKIIIKTDISVENTAFAYLIRKSVIEKSRGIFEKITKFSKIPLFVL